MGHEPEHIRDGLAGEEAGLGPAARLYLALAACGVLAAVAVGWGSRAGSIPNSLPSQPEAEVQPVDRSGELAAGAGILAGVRSLVPGCIVGWIVGHGC